MVMFFEELVHFFKFMNIKLFVVSPFIFLVIRICSDLCLFFLEVYAFL